MLVFEPFFLKWYPVGPYACLYILNKVISLEKYLSYDLCKGPLSALKPAERGTPHPPKRKTFDAFYRTYDFTFTYEPSVSTADCPVIIRQKRVDNIYSVHHENAGVYGKYWKIIYMEVCT